MKRFLQTLALVGVIAGSLVVLPATVSAQVDPCSGAGANSTYCKGAAQGQSDVMGIVKNIINLLLTAIGVISVIMIIVGGINFALSNGDAQKVTKARNTILYAVIGLIVAIFSYAIVDFAFNRVK